MFGGWKAPDESSVLPSPSGLLFLNVRIDVGDKAIFLEIVFQFDSKLYRKVRLQHGSRTYIAVCPCWEFCAARLGYVGRSAFFQVRLIFFDFIDCFRLRKRRESSFLHHNPPVILFLFMHVHANLRLRTKHQISGVLMSTKLKVLTKAIFVLANNGWWHVS